MFSKFSTIAYGKIPFILFFEYQVPTTLTKIYGLHRIFDKNSTLEKYCSDILNTSKKKDILAAAGEEIGPTIFRI